MSTPESALKHIDAASVVEELLRRVAAPPEIRSEQHRPPGPDPVRIPCIAPTGYRFTAEIQHGVVARILDEIPPPLNTIPWPVSALKDPESGVANVSDLAKDINGPGRFWFFVNLRRPVYELVSKELPWHYRIDQQHMVTKMADLMKASIDEAEARAKAAMEAERAKSESLAPAPAPSPEPRARK